MRGNRENEKYKKTKSRELVSLKEKMSSDSVMSVRDDA
jgi:hypothetical protein